MNPTEKPLTAIARAHLAYELMVHRQREAILRQRSLERSRTITVVAICIGMAALILSTAIYNNWIPTSLRSATLRNTDDDRFGETRTGQVRSFIRGNTCRELRFNNDRGVYVSGSLVPCEVEVRREAPPPVKGERFNSIRDAFTTR
jgi:hypothetical protein